jgi:putative FmdB family regulatory protein
MPTYAYQCPKCGHRFDKLQKISDRSRAKCPTCGTRGQRLISGGAGLVFKGSGFYATDYKRKGSEEGKQTTEKPEKDKKSRGPSKPDQPSGSSGAEH